MFAILCGANGRRHEVDFKDDPVIIDVFTSTAVMPFSGLCRVERTDVRPELRHSCYVGIIRSITNRAFGPLNPPTTCGKACSCRAAMEPSCRPWLDSNPHFFGKRLANPSAIAIHSFNAA
jgi:hypothetical protein